MDLPSSDDYQRILLSGAALLDVRAPVEFAQGAFPTAVNLPLLNDTEREQIGIQYKQHGQQAAIELGHAVVSGTVKAERVAAWRRFAEANPQGYLYCFRGGLRSRISQQWLADAGLVYPRISGGYKAMRRFLLDELNHSVERLPILVLGGRTGVAKTRFLHTLPYSVDLEALANHRGSAFGRELSPQPTPINFENTLSLALLRLRAQNAPWVLLEDEGSNVGSLSIPQVLVDAMASAPMLILETTLTARVQHILQEYVIDKQADYQHCYGADEGFEQFSHYLLDSLGRIRKRLGPLRYR
ncbi:MAG: tRNA 2-selenouridine(34) synthase MnmH, partial [Candidatus Competibacteraceae bacterium]|nr:tRNA 2-selenouridine(34) synthase MnmH [Candidatus Competibacteraceae bacterium]